MEQLQTDRKGLTGFNLKIIGIILMVFDHIHQMFYMFGVPLWFTMLGRLVAPIFLFLSAEGFHYTKSKKRYLFRLWAAYVLMAFASSLIQRTLPSDVVLLNSIFGTLFLSAFYMWMIDLFSSGIKEKKASKVLLSIIGMLFPIILNIAILPLFAVTPPPIPIAALSAIINLIPLPLFVEGTFAWIILGVSFYLLRNKSRWIQVMPIIVIGVMSFIQGMNKPANINWLMIFSAVLISFYNGKQGKKMKYFFYIFYPAHIYIFYIISYLMQSK